MVYSSSGNFLAPEGYAFFYLLTHTPEIVITPTIIQRVLWFLSANSSHIPANFLDEIILEFIQHESSGIRGTVFKLLYQTASIDTIQMVIDSEWSWKQNKKDKYETLWGSLLIAEYGTNLSFSEVKQRIHPAYLGYAVRNRGNREVEINEFIEELDRLVKLMQDKAPELPSNFPAVTLDSNQDVEDDLLIVQQLSLYKPYDITMAKSVNRYASWGGSQANGEHAWKAFFDDTYLDNQKALNTQKVIDAIEQQMLAGNILFDTRLDSAKFFLQPFSLGQAKRSLRATNIPIPKRQGMFETG